MNISSTSSEERLRQSLENMCQFIEEDLTVSGRVLLIEPNALIDALRGFLYGEESRLTALQRKALGDAVGARLRSGEPLAVISPFARKPQK